jgi:hypothetical protein
MQVLLALLQAKGTSEKRQSSGKTKNPEKKQRSFPIYNENFQSLWPL